ncbi:SpoIID/LytB domain-containing protein [Phycicoccus flavus]|uniref:SpoIID/LytB domain-containing protein n=1 Tax=Phycicoccus flavus TaxID=2502783 RepID=A0A8T6R287_9MICO|nr:SpoIID/LytB domain-containing protein [Phycicoccus flavus]NHA68006.1 SpoIID/LytB domain-containing protein [Phycicoccus flavus]
MRPARAVRVLAALAVAALATTAAPAAGAEDVPWGVDQPRPVPGPAGPGEPVAPVAPAAPDASGAAAALSSTWTLSGSGWGHGVGMSQYGAYEMGRDGYSAAEILGHYYTGTAYETREDDATLRVNVRQRVGSTTLRTSRLGTGGGSFSIAVSGGATVSGGVGDTVTVRPSGSEITVSCPTCAVTSSTGARPTVTWDDDRTLLSVDGTLYRDGMLRVTRTPGAASLEVVMYVRIHDEYLDYLREVPWSWPAATLQAQAAAARGYALRRLQAGVSTSCNCHLYDDSRSQVFGGYPSGSVDRSYLPAWTAAVDAAGSPTRGYVATYGGAVIDAYYSSSTGGRTQNSEDVWTSALPYLRSVDDHWSQRSSNPRRAWTATPARSTLAAAFGLGDVRRLDLSDRYASGAVATARATSSSGTTVALSGESLRGRLGLYSTYLARPTSRVAGTDRYVTAAKLAATRARSATTVVVVSGEDSARPDAAVGGPLAQSLAAPMLLTRATRLPAATRDAIAARPDLRRAVVVGGPAAVSPDVVTALQGLGLSVSRIGGANRYAVAANVAADIDRRGAVSAVVLASGESLVDALGAGGPAGAVREPVLLTRRDTLPAETSDALATTGAGTVRVVGGTTSVSGAVETGLRRTGLTVQRLAGGSRYASAAAVAAFYRDRLGDTTRVSLASGADGSLADALTAGSIGRITLLTGSATLPAPTSVVLQETPDLERVVAVGGTRVVSTTVLRTAGRQ